MKSNHLYIFQDDRKYASCCIHHKHVCCDADKDMVVRKFCCTLILLKIRNITTNCQNFKHCLYSIRLILLDSYITKEIIPRQHQTLPNWENCNPIKYCVWLSYVELQACRTSSPECTSLCIMLPLRMDACWRWNQRMLADWSPELQA